MLEKEQLRKADIFSGLAIFLFGLFIVLMASEMPMKDSWGGVQNVWYVSPALFPLFVAGAMFWSFEFRSFGFVSGFDIRISSFFERFRI